MKRLLQFLFVFIAALPAGAQHPAAEQIGVEQGLSQGFVTCLAQDREGFIWMGSSDSGLNRFDGQRFKQFTADPFDINSLPGNFIYQVADMGDYLFVGTLNEGASFYHKKSGKFFRLPFKKVQKKEAIQPEPGLKLSDELPAPAARYYLTDEDGSLWLACHRHPLLGVWVVRVFLPPFFWEQLPTASEEQQAALLTNLKFESQYFENCELGLMADGKTLFLQADEKLFRRKGEQWEALPLPAGLAPRLRRVVEGTPETGVQFWQTTDGEVWSVADGGNLWNKVADVPPGGFVRCMEKNNAWVWFGNRFETIPLGRQPFRFDWQHPVASLESRDERPFYMLDRSGNFWFVNGVEGVSKYNLQTAAFHHTHTDEVERFHYPFFTGEGGVLSYFTKDKKIYIVGQPAGLAHFIQSEIDRQDVRDGIVRSDNRNRVLVVGRKQVIIIDLRSKTSTSYEFPANKMLLPGESLFDTDGSALLSFGGALIHLAPGQDSAFCLDYGYAVQDGLYVSDIEKTVDGSVWMALGDGLLRIFPEKGERMEDREFQVSTNPAPRRMAVFRAKTQLYFSNPDDRSSLNNNRTTCLLTDPADPNLLWVGTRGGGMNRFDLSTGKFAHITTANGLTDDVVYGILPDSRGNLWVSTNKGLSRYNPVSGKFKNFRMADGLQHDEFNTNSFAKDGNGKLYFGGINGMNVFDPAEIMDNPNKPGVVLTGLWVNDRPIAAGDSTGILKTAIEFCSEITLPYSKNSISLEFAALEFTAPSKNRYRYWLEGFEKENAHESSKPEANYIGLPPGRYTFIVYGTNNSGVWSDEPARLKITILPPWYRSSAAYLFYLLIALGLAYWAVRHYQLEMREKEARHQLAINRVKLDDFARLLVEKSKMLEELQARKASASPVFIEMEDTAAFKADEEYGPETETTEKKNGPNNSPDLVEYFFEGQLIPDIQILTKEDWEKFQQMFEDANPGFLQELSDRFPQLTPAETRLLLLTKMGLDKKEIASMLGISPDSVKKTRYRIRKKLDMLGQNLEDLFPSE